MPKVRSLFLSDIHLGTRACQADQLIDFLREYSADNTFLVGDIIDFWAMNRSIHWTPAQNTVVQKLLRRARHGERIVFIRTLIDGSASSGRSIESGQTNGRFL